MNMKNREAEETKRKTPSTIQPRRRAGPSRPGQPGRPARTRRPRAPNPKDPGRKNTRKTKRGRTRRAGRTGRRRGVAVGVGIGRERGVTIRNVSEIRGLKRNTS
jgi:hypothetical protein